MNCSDKPASFKDQCTARPLISLACFAGPPSSHSYYFLRGKEKGIFLVTGGASKSVWRPVYGASYWRLTVACSAGVAGCFEVEI